MAKLLLFCALTSSFALCWSISQELPDKPGYCRAFGIYIKAGRTSSTPLGTCSSVTCADGNHPTFSALTCAWFQPRPGCARSDHDYTKLYPDCCPKEVCE